MNKKSLIISIILSLIIITAVVLCGIHFKYDNNIETIFNAHKYTENKNANETNERIIRVDGKLYYDTGKESTIEYRCGMMDGSITSHVSEKEIPTQDDQANFLGDYSYQYGLFNTIDVVIDGKWITFKLIEQ